MGINRQRRCALNQTAVVGQDTALNIQRIGPRCAAPDQLATRIVEALVLAVGEESFACDRAVGVGDSNGGKSGRFGGFNTPGLVVERTCLRGDADRVLHRTDGARLIVDLARRQDDLPIGCEQALSIVGGLSGAGREQLPGGDLPLRVVEAVARNRRITASGDISRIAVVDFSGGSEDEVRSSKPCCLNRSTLILQCAHGQRGGTVAGYRAAGVVQLDTRDNGGSTATILRHGAALMRKRGTVDFQLLRSRSGRIERRIGGRQVKRTIAGYSAPCSIKCIGVNGQSARTSMLQITVCIRERIRCDIHIDTVACNSALGVIEVARQIERHIAAA